MIYKAKKGQISYGEAVGIILLDTYAPFIPGDVGNASTYQFPVRFTAVKGFTVDRIMNKDITALDDIFKAGQGLVREGVKAITGDCGYLALYQKELAERLDVPVFMTSLLQVPFISSFLGKNEKIGIICANSKALDRALLEGVGISIKIPIVIKGMEDQPYFYQAALQEIGELNSEQIEKEVVNVAIEIWAGLELTTSMIFLGSFVVISKIIITIFPIYLASALRLLFALLILIPLLYILEKGFPKISKKDLGIIFLESFTGVFLFSIFLLYGLQYVSAANGGIIISTTPAIIGIIAYFFLKERISWKMGAGICIVVIGLVSIHLLDFFTGIEKSTTVNIGILFMFGAVLGDYYC